MNPTSDRRNLLISFLVSILLFVGSCGTSSENNSSDLLDHSVETEIGSLLWVNEFHSDSAVKEAVRHTLDNSTMIIAQISWSPHDSNFFNNASWYHNLAKEHNKKFMLSVEWQDFYRTGTLGDWSFEDDSVQLEFKKDMLKLAEEYSPDYFQPGVEINYYGLIDPDGYRGFIEVFNELKTEIASNNIFTEVGLSFQLELLFGVHKEWDKNRTLETLDAVRSNLDYIGVSTYPDEYYKSETDVSGSLRYLDSLCMYYQNPVIISETAVSSLKFKSETRRHYQNLLFNKAKELEIEALIWGSMIDDKKLSGWQYCTGLLNSDGTPKEDFENWVFKSSEIKPKV